MQRFFFATEGDLLRIPGLSNLFEKVDQVISDYLEEHKGEVDENEVRRFTAGHIANDDLVETEGNFKVLGKSDPRDWDILMGMAMTQLKRPQIEADTIHLAKKMKVDMESNDQLKAEFDEKKKRAIDSNAKESNISARREMYKRDVKKVKQNLYYMYANYRSHMILVSVTEDPRKQYLYPGFTFGNSGSSID